MIDIKRNSKKEPIEATGIRSRRSSYYKPNQKEDFKISCGRFTNFLTCQKFFYLDRVKGLYPLWPPEWTFNKTTDWLLKNELIIVDKNRLHTEHLNLMDLLMLSL